MRCKGFKPLCLLSLAVGCVLLSGGCAASPKEAPDAETPSGFTVSLPDQDYIRLSDSFQAAAPAELYRYRSERKRLDLGSLSDAFFSSSDLSISDQADDGTASLRSSNGFMQVVMSDFYYYNSFFDDSGELRRPFDAYSAWLSLVEPGAEGLRYAYIPDTYLSAGDFGFSSDEVIQNARDLFAPLLVSPIDLTPYRTEKVSEEDLTRLVNDSIGLNREGADLLAEFTPCFYRVFGEFTLDGLPVLSPKNELVSAARMDGRKVLLPYVEVLADQEGIQYVSAIGFPAGLSKEEPVQTSSPQEALDIFAAYFSDVILEEDTAVSIQAMEPRYAALSDRQNTVTYEPVWAVVYQQGGVTKNLCVCMQSGELL